MVLVKLNKLFVKKYCDIAQTEVQGSSEKKKYSSTCYITCRGALKSHVFHFKTSEYAVRVCNMDTWQANALSYFKCWCKNALSFSPDPGSSPNSLMVRDLLSLSSPALIFLSSSSLLCSHECFLCHFSLFFSSLSFFIHLLTDHIWDSWAQLSLVPLRVPSQSMMWSCLQCFIKALHTKSQRRKGLNQSFHLHNLS